MAKTLRDRFDEDLDIAMDYESDIDFVWPNRSPLASITGEDDTSRAPSPFFECGAVNTLTALRTSPDVASPATVNTNLLDEQQIIDNE